MCPRNLAIAKVVFCLQAELMVERFKEGCGEVDIGQDDKFKRMIRQNK